MKTVLSIGAHPDDIEIGCAGTEILLKEKGYRIIHVIATNGEEGSLDLSQEQLAQKRQEEARKSASKIGVDDLRFLSLPDGLTSFTKEVKLELIKIIREFAPEIVFTHSSSDHFPDHAIIHSLTVAAIEGAKGPWYPLASGKPHRVEKVFGYEVWHPLNQHQLAVDITKSMSRKLLALEEHFSQTEGVNYLDAVSGLAKYRGAMTMLGEYAEVFEVLSTSASCLL